MGTTAALIALGAGGLLGGAASGVIGASSARKNNEESLDFSKWSQLQSQQYNKEMYEQQLADQESMYNKYQSPQAIAQQLRAAGMNPSAMNQSMSSGQIPSVPSAGTSSPVSAPSLENEGAYYAKSIEQISSAIGSVAGGSLDIAQQRETNALLSAKLENITKQNNLLESQRIYQDLNNLLTEKYGDKKWAQDIDESISRAALNYINGDLAKANEAYTNALKLIADEQLPITQAERQNIATKIALGNQLIQSEIKANNSQVAANRSLANLNNAQARTVNELRKWQVEYHHQIAEIAQTDNFVKLNSAWNEVQKSLAELQAAELLPEQIRVDIEGAKKRNDWYEINEILGVVDTGVKAYGTVKGAKAGQQYVNSQDVRNNIQSEYNQYLRDKDDREYKRIRSAVAGDGNYR